MGFWNATKKLGSAAAQTCCLPFDVVRDTITMGGALEGNGRGEPATIRRIKKVGRDINDSYEETRSEY